MKNINIRKKLLTLAMFSTIGLVSNKNIVKANGNDIVNIHEFDYIRDYVKASEDIFIKERPNSTSNELGILKKDDKLKLISQIDGYYEVLYNEEIAYVRDNSVTVESEKPFLKSAYVNKKSNLYSEEACINVVRELNELEYLKIYDELDNSYSVEIDGISGYVFKDSVSILDNLYAVVDISDQHVELYQDNKLVMESDVVTGRPRGNSTPIGVYAIGTKANDVTHDRNLVGPGYQSYVNYMMKFNGHIGFHDAEYHTDANGRKHGWRTREEFGGETYLTNGSHGCVNMPNDAASKMYEYVYPYVVEQGKQVKVLVKE